jgi:hypothetical protein
VSYVLKSDDDQYVHYLAIRGPAKEYSLSPLQCLAIKVPTAELAHESARHFIGDDIPVRVVKLVPKPAAKMWALKWKHDDDHVVFSAEDQGFVVGSANATKFATREEAIERLFKGFEYEAVEVDA